MVRQISDKPCECGCGEFTNLAEFTHKRYGWVKDKPLRFIVGHVARLKSPPKEDAPNTTNGLCECGCGEAAPIAPHSNRKYGWVANMPLRFVHGHHARKDPERIFDEENYIIDKNGCWIWVHNKSSKGYGRVSVDGKPKPVHRIAYELKVGSIPDKFEVDHMCENPPCFNPDHLQAVTHKENIRLASVRSGERTREEILLTIHEQRDKLQPTWSGEQYLEDSNGCWIWMKGISSRGYGRVWVKEDYSMRYAHRVMYEKENGKIGEGLVLHHMCENHICVNPSHLEPVTNGENVNKRWDKRREGS